MITCFASDNAAGAHPRIMEAVMKANSGCCKPYGQDEYSAEAVRLFKQLFGEDIAVCLGLSGTGVNVLGLRAMMKPWHGIICSDCAHINTDESGAPEWGIGGKVLAVPSVNGKITPAAMDKYLADLGNIHRSKPAVLSITQSTEQGSVYTVEEVKALAHKAHAHGLKVHMDGSRIANAVASLNVDVREVTRDAGVDVLSFGGAKNGLMLAEAIIFFDATLAEEIENMRKQSLQLVSKMRFVGVQFVEALKDGLWLENARNANGMARLLAEGLNGLPHMEVPEPPAANAVFVRMEPRHIAALQKLYYCHEFDPEKHLVRLMCSFATTMEDVAALVKTCRALAD